jgi:hypothetical protein
LLLIARLGLRDPSKAAKKGWQHVTDTWAAGASVWKKQLGYQPGMFTYNGQCIELPGINEKTKELVSPGLPILALPTDALVSAITCPNVPALQFPVNFWDRPYALAVYDPKTEAPDPAHPGGANPGVGHDLHPVP